MRAKTQIYLLDLRDDPDIIARYRAWHLPGAIPPAVTQSIRDAGVEEMRIFLCGNRLVMLLDPGPDFDPLAKAARDASDPAVVAWERAMDAYQIRLPFAKGGEKWVRADAIYALSDQPA